jgi:hypothetical protein
MAQCLQNCDIVTIMKFVLSGVRMQIVFTKYSDSVNLI